MVVTADQFVAGIRGGEAETSLDELRAGVSRLRDRICYRVRQADRVRPSKTRAAYIAATKVLRERHDEMSIVAAECQLRPIDGMPNHWECRADDECEGMASVALAKYRGLGWIK